MKALTVLQPWAWAIASGLKRVENRTWQTPYRGPLLIHAGKSDRLVGQVDLPEAPALLTFGAVVATCRLVDVVERDWLLNQIHGSRRFRDLGTRLLYAAQERFIEGPYCWLLDDVREVQPIPLKGWPGLFPVPDDLVRRLQLPHGSD